MDISPSLAGKLFQMMQGNQSVPASSLSSPIVSHMIDDGVITRIQLGPSHRVLRIPDHAAMNTYLRNKYGINDLEEYVNRIGDDNLTRGDLVSLSSNSKTRQVRTFEGFLVNCYQPLACHISGQHFELSPTPGTFVFISDYKSFVPPVGSTIIGIENAENFKHIDKQQHLFKGLNPLFVCRYPYSADLIRWLKAIPNRYLHFGDIDFFGIEIFMNEYKKHLGDKAEFFLPDDFETLLKLHGSRSLYKKQAAVSSQKQSYTDILSDLIRQFHEYQKVLEQEIFLL